MKAQFKPACWVNILSIIVAATLLAACGGPAATPTALPTQTTAPTAAPSATFPPTSTPTPTDSPTPAPTNTPSATPTPQWQQLDAKDLFLAFSYPPGWVYQDEGSVVVIASSYDVLTNSVTAGGAMLVVSREREAPWSNATPLSELQAGLSLWTLDGQVETTSLAGQPAVTAPVVVSASGGNMRGELTVAIQHPAKTLIILVSSAENWTKYQATLRQIRASMVFKDPLVDESALPSELTQSQGMLTTADLPSGFSPVSPYAAFEYNRSEGPIGAWLSHIGPGLAAARAHQLQVFQRGSGNSADSVTVFLAYPLSRREAQAYDTLLADPQQLASAIAEYSGSIYTTAKTTAKATPMSGCTKLGEASQGIANLAKYTDENTEPMETFPTYVVVRHGAVLAIVRYEYGYAAVPLADNALCSLAQTLDGYVEELIAGQPDLAKPLAQAAKDPLLAPLSQVTNGQFDLPESLREDPVPEDSGAGIGYTRLAGFGSRLLSSSKFAREAQAVQLYAVYPLDDTESRALDWLFQNPERLTEYVLGEFLNDWGVPTFLFYASNFRTLPSPLPTGLGDSAGGVTIVLGNTAEDVVLVRRANVLVAAMVTYAADGKPGADVVALASQLDGQVKQILDSGGKVKMPPTRTPPPSPTPTSKPSPTPIPHYANAKAPTLGTAADAEAALKQQEVQYLGELAPERYSSDEQMQMNTTFTYTVALAANKPMLWGYSWCATTDAILKDNLQHMSIQFLMNESAVDLSHFYTYTKEGSGVSGKTSLCQSWVAVISDWPRVKTEFKSIVTFDAKINDGQGDYGPGSQTYKYIVTHP